MKTFPVVSKLTLAIHFIIQLTLKCMNYSSFRRFSGHNLR